MLCLIMTDQISLLVLDKCSGVAKRLLLCIAVVSLVALYASGQVCSHPTDPDFYQNHGYIIRKIEIRNPFNFIFFVRNQMDKVKRHLSVVEGKPFTTAQYNESAKYVEDAVTSDDSFGTSPAKLVVKTVSIENCQESEAAAKTLDIIYRILSTDPGLSVAVPPENRQSSVNEPANTAVEEGTKSSHKVRPVGGYEDAVRGYGGADFRFEIPGALFQNGHLTASGSPSSGLAEFQLNGSRSPKLAALDRVDYHLAYDYSSQPAGKLRIAKGSFQVRFTAVSKPLGNFSSRVLIRYGSFLEVGNQHSNVATVLLPSDTVTNSSYGSLRFFIGATRMTRYTEAILSYGLQIGGTGLNNVSFARQVADLSYSRRQGGTHTPWDLKAQLSLGLITGSSGIPLSERFFGGNSVTNFIPGDAWLIPSGPTIRSIPSNRLNGQGFGGTSFYSTNLTIGKVIWAKPLIPKDIQEADGFRSGISAAEDSAQSWFTLDYLTASPEYKQLVTTHAPILRADIDNVQSILQSIPVTSGSDKVLKEAARQAKLAQNGIRSATVPDARGRVNPSQLNVLANPATSRLVKLIALFPQLKPHVTPTVSAELAASQASINKHLLELRTALHDIQLDEPGHPGHDAAIKARQVMERPREIIDTLQNETNRFSFSIVGILDSARLRPDPNGTRYALGGGGRFSLVNVNLTLGYAVNPHPRSELGQGRGAVVFTLTYTNLFR